MTENSQDAQNTFNQMAEEFYDQFVAGEIPEISIPTRSKGNIEYDEENGIWVLGDKTTKRTANNRRGSRKLLKLIYTMQFLEQQLDEERSSTLRELYYLSESWENNEAQFNDQDESNRTVEDLEVYTGFTREDFHMRPEESGATLIGPLTIREETRRGEREIHCQNDVGEGGYQIPSNPETVEFIDHDVDFVLAVETGGMRDRLVENGFDDDYNCLVVHLKGQPARATRRITKRLQEELNLPVTVFTDADPWSYRIFASVAYGSINSAHVAKYLTTPEAKFIGIQPTDIVEYDLPTDPLTDSDINALESELEDPRFQSEYWEEQINTQLKINQKSEQQSLASRGLDFVTDTYLPERLEEMDVL